MEHRTNEETKTIPESAKTGEKTTVRRQRILILISLAVLALCIPLGALLLPALPETSILRSDKFWKVVGFTSVAILWAIVIIERRKNTPQG